MLCLFSAKLKVLKDLKQIIKGSLGACIFPEHMTDISLNCPFLFQKTELEIGHRNKNQHIPPHWLG